MHLDIRTLQSGQASELYLTATPSPSQPGVQAARAMLGAVAEALRQADARICQERIFALPEAIEWVRSLRADAYGGLADDVAPSLLVGGSGRDGGPGLAGLQVHAVVGPLRSRTVRCGRQAHGRAVELPGRAGQAVVALTGLTAPYAGSSAEQARALFEMAEACLRPLGGGWPDVTRTWLWLGDILPWYDQLNRVRNEFFAQRGLSGGAAAVRLPASTGVGVRPALGGACALDLIAAIDAAQPARYLVAAGKQGSPAAYGSAFSRAVRAGSPAGQTVFVSGTASIDAQGATIHLDQPHKQVAQTIENVQAVLAEQGCGDGDVVQAIAYCKTAQVEDIWRTVAGQLGWPCVTVRADICRADLLFELEATACPGAGKGPPRSARELPLAARE